MVVRKIKRRGFVDIFILLFLIVAAWFIFKSAVIVYRKTQIEGLLSSAVLEARLSFNEQTVVEKIVERLQSKFTITVDPSAVLVYRTLDGNHVRVEVAYSEPIRVFHFGWGWDTDMLAAVSEVLNMK